MNALRFIIFIFTYMFVCVCVYFLFYQLTGSFCFVSKQRAYTTSTSASALVPAMQAGVILLTEIRPLFHRPWITPATNGRNTERWVRLCFVFFLSIHYRCSPMSPSPVKNSVVVYLPLSDLCTASQSPLGLASGSLTPPPTMGGSASNLQLGLMGGSTNNANRSLMNAAPGAEAMSKFRASGTET